MIKKSKKYDHKDIESKWQREWLDKRVYQPDLKNSRRPFYNLMMFPYPSAEGLHVGNMYAFTGADVYGRFKRMMGYDVFEPIGLDGFGIHSENYAIKVGRHPKEHAKISEKNFYRQLMSIGDGFAWENRLETYDPEYYKWTQWLFIQMFKAGLAYKGKAMVNWCPFDKTVLADEQVEGGKCERCKTEVERREMSSWFFKITKYADRLLTNIEKIDWPEKIKIAQRQWIGKSEGLSIEFSIVGSKHKINTWTKYWETIYGVTFIVLAPEHKILKKLKIPEKNKILVTKYIKDALNKSEQERKVEVSKTGVFTGLYAVNPVNNKKVQIWVADYVLMDVGTGAVMGVPSHDKRDFDFAKKYNLETIQVIEGNLKGESFQGEGKIMNSGQWNGKNSRGKDKEDFADWLVKSGFAKKEISYHLRDWLISRQRYWGPPIPMINCKKCGFVPVKEEDLPVLLPDIEDFRPKGDGISPLNNAPESWKSTVCPNCGGTAERELDVSDTFLDSSWYFLRYPSFTYSKGAFDPVVTKKWLPVSAYIGGAEHAVLHLLYSRFVTMVLKDLKHITFEEPFPFLFAHGLIIKDGAKMSKSRGNVVVPDTYIEKYGADTLRTYLMFLGPYNQGGDFRDNGIEGMNRFLNKVWNLFENNKEVEKNEKNLTTLMHQTIKKVSYDLDRFHYNTAISSIMQFVNFMRDNGSNKEALRVLCKLLAPFAPHMTEEVWGNVLKEKFSVHKALWPKYDEKLVIDEEMVIVLMVDGKPRDQIVVSGSTISKAEVLKKALESNKIKSYIRDIEIKDIIFVSGKLLNIVTK